MMVLVVFIILVARMILTVKIISIAHMISIVRIILTAYIYFFRSTVWISKTI